jgi:hypothetical protein
MTELEAYKFVRNQGCDKYDYNVSQCTWEHNYENGRKGELTLCIWVKPDALPRLCKLLGATAFNDGGICECSLCNTGDVCISNFDEVLEHYGIEPENIEPKEKTNG